MSRRFLAITSVLALLVFSGLTLALPATAASSTVKIEMPPGAGAGTSAAPGFTPDTVTVVIGVNNTIEWTNNETLTHHDVYSSTIPTGAASWQSPDMPPGAGYTQTLTVPGTYYFYCSYHAWMTGTVVVKAATTPSPEFPASALAFTLLAVLAAVMLVAPRFKAPLTIKS